ncbi:hypothetical protein BMI85_20220 [Thioclava sp. DLFJ4-1]|nr:hypothetical protein BMI85_20220 [Thioclava sp. DLFJ4-1]
MGNKIAFRVALPDAKSGVHSGTYKILSRGIFLGRPKRMKLRGEVPPMRKPDTARSASSAYWRAKQLSIFIGNY